MLADLHIHSILSPDGYAPLADMAQAALEAGVNALTVTDHFDLLTSDGQRDLSYPWAPALEQFSKTAPQFQDRLTLGLGLELGSAPVCPESARAVLAQAGDALDQVIGSLHNFREENGGGEYFYARFDTPAACHAALEDYFTSMEELVAMPDCYDVLGHIIYPLRYFHRDGQPMTLRPYWDRLAAILRTVIDTGRSIEVNTCRGANVEDWQDILLLYKDLGGSLVTTGSDAHRPADVAKGLKQASALLEQCGFHKVAVYRRRQPVLYTIS
ncbi:MAG: histidinol-phosphatase HisJ family protein [Oscillospiraceae bacterium]|nr:histidinol-phosphatase HisJ family protein [Oscillospiraceae bacterium]